MRSGRDEMRDAVREHPRLARAGTRDDQERTTRVFDRVALVGVELRQVERDA